jgi:hypothetical protein
MDTSHNSGGCILVLQINCLGQDSWLTKGLYQKTNKQTNNQTGNVKTSQGLKCLTAQSQLIADIKWQALSATAHSQLRFGWGGES